MVEVTKNEGAERDRILLGLLESVERNGSQTQRGLASELGIALGLVNAYLKRCVKKGLVKVRQAPARRYAYYLTPSGFAEKSRLTVEYFSYSLSFFRQARIDCSAVIAHADARGWSRIALAGASELAEIARLCALEGRVEICLVLDPDAPGDQYAGVPMVRSFDDVPSDIHAVVVTDLRNARDTFDAAVKRFGEGRVVAPSLLGLGARPPHVELG